MSNPTVLIFLPVSGLWLLMGAVDWRRRVSGALLSAFVFLLCLTPWTVRNWLAFGRFVPNARETLALSFIWAMDPERPAC